MYVNNQFDNLIDKILTNFNEFIMTSDFLKKIKDINFVTYQNLILEKIKDFINTLSKKEIIDIIKNEVYYNNIINIIKRYCAFYIYLGIAYNYTGGRDLFITNIIESSKYQKDAVIQIDNFFNSDSNSKIIIFYNDIKNLIELFSLKSIDKIKLSIKNNPIRFERINKIFFNINDEDEIIQNYLIPNNFHNIIKFFIIKLIYGNEERNEIQIPIEFR